LQQPGAIVAFLLLVVVSVVAFLYALSWRVGVVTLGEKENRLDNPGQRFGNFIMNVFAQRRLLTKNIGIVHFFIFWGFIFICLGEIPLLFEGLFGMKVPFFSTNPYFIMVQNVISVIVVIVLLVAVYRRWVLKTRLPLPHFGSSHNCHLNLRRSGYRMVCNRSQVGPGAESGRSFCPRRIALLFHGWPA